MINHSCEPNLRPAWIKGTGEISLIATRDIEINEEFTVTYIDNTMPIEARRESLFMNYGFHCNCIKCLEEEKRI